MQKTMPERMVGFSIKHAWFVIAVTILVTLVFGWFAVKIKINPDFTSLMPKNSQIDALLKEYGGGGASPDLLVLAVTADKGGSVFDPKALAAYGEAVSAIQALPGVRSVVSPFNLVSFGRENGRLAIRQMSPGGVAPEPGAAEELRARLSRARYAQNLVVSGDGTMLISYFQAEPQKSFKGFMDKVDAIANAMRAKGLTPYVTGTIPLAVRTEYHLSRDATRLLILAALIILISYVATFRHLRAISLPLLTALLGTLWTVGFMALMGFSLSLISIVAPPLILIFGNEYAIYTTSEYLRVVRVEGTSPGWIARAGGNVTMPILIAVLTTAIGFLSLLTTSISQTREFAVTASFGSAACAFLALFFLPALYSRFPPPAERKDRLGTGFRQSMRLLARFAYRFPAVVLALLGAAVVLFAVTVRFLTFNTDPAGYFPESDPVLQDMAAIYGKAGGYEQIAVSFDAPAGEAGYFLDADVLARVQGVERKLLDIPDISYAVSLPDLLQYINAGATGEDTLPQNRAIITVFSRLLTASGSTSPTGSVLGNLANKDFTRLTVSFRIYNSRTGHYMDENTFRALLASIRTVLAENPIGATPVVWSDLLRNLSFADSLRRTLLVSMGISLVSILALTVLVFRSLLFGVYSLAPLCVGLLLNYSMMALTRIPLDMTTIMVSNIAIGVGVDSAIYLVIQFRRELARSPADPLPAFERTLAIMGQPVLLSSLSIVFGLLTFATAAFLPIVYFGMLVLFTLLATTFGTLVTLPALLTVDTRVRRAWANRRESPKRGR